eukprot:CAMPEP_0184685578 /NCGR_PEP_ID=MMETSP0312-20130426/19476_1 /TAXON_ID=31354 /ORGANISM="Compsopogon coeruleus, Strain SAG 36.94" /LENGTH=361 /DNA_ID=CAMNT_0027139799 /DNA_START=418 /DNA_END=1503 /DNA_ORIENTATION=+
MENDESNEVVEQDRRGFSEFHDRAVGLKKENPLPKSRIGSSTKSRSRISSARDSSTSTIVRVKKKASSHLPRIPDRKSTSTHGAVSYISKPDSPNQERSWGTQTLPRMRDGSSGETSSELSRHHNNEDDGSSQPSENIDGSPGTSDGDHDGKFRGVKLGIVDGVNISRLSFMIYRLIISNDFHSMIDFPCLVNAGWMPQLVMQLDFEIPGFQFFCGELSERNLNVARRSYRQLESVEFFRNDVGRSDFPEADVILTWSAFHDWGLQDSWAHFKAVSCSNISHIMFETNPTVNNMRVMQGLPQEVTEEGREPPRGLNSRRPPFLFDPPIKSVGGITQNGSEPRILVLYQANGLRDGFGKELC